MTALATLPDLELMMERTIGDDESRRAQRLLEIASERVRTFTGRRFEQTTETKRLRVRNSRVRLPQGPVTAVSAVEDTNGNALTYTWLAGQVVDLCANPLNSWEIEPFRRGLRWVDVTYTHGWETIPADIVGIVCEVAAAAFTQPIEATGIQSETLGDYTVTTSTATPSGVRLTQQQRDALAPYMMGGGTIAVA